MSLKENQRALDRAVQDAASSQAELVSLRAEQARSASQAISEPPAAQLPTPLPPVANTPASPSVSSPPAVGNTVLPPPPPQLRSRVIDVRFDEDEETSRVMVTVDGEADYVVRRDGDRTRILEVRKALIDPSQERNLDTSDFPGAVKLVSSYQAAPPGDRVNIVVTLSDDVKD